MRYIVFYEERLETAENVTVFIVRVFKPNIRTYTLENFYMYVQKGHEGEIAFLRITIVEIAF